MSSSCSAPSRDLPAPSMSGFSMLPRAARNRMRPNSLSSAIAARWSAERGLAFGWSAPMVSHAEEVPVLASRITDALYERLEKGRAVRVTVVHVAPAPSATIEIVEQALLPFDFARFKVALRAVPPITTLPAEQLLAELAEKNTSMPSCARR